MSKLNTHSPQSKHLFIGESVRHSLAEGTYLFNKMENQEEIWKDIKGYEGIYSISKSGQIVSCFGKILSEQITNSGYSLVHLMKNRKRKAHTVHRLVAINFLLSDISQLSMQVDHLDGNKQNNSVENLEFVTHTENVRRAWSCGLHETTRQKAAERMSVMSTKNATANGLRLSKLKYSKITIIDISTKNKTQYNSFREASKEIGLERKQMSIMAKRGIPYKGKLIIWDKVNIEFEN